ncbi:MAG TPA: T9SS type A sorting domain-containing protein [Verrucomicrobiae bacterium]|nr:T9SS type A sorting domain-containing protein [Verrucomicrobiae bacterium]
MLSPRPAPGAVSVSLPPDSIPPSARPGYLVPSVDPAFGTQVTRITNDTGQPTDPVPGVWGADARHVYGTQEPWNADQTLIILQNLEGGSPTRLVLDGRTYEPLFTLCDAAGLFDYRWHPSPAHAHELINVTNDGRALTWVDIVNCVQTRAWGLPIAVNYGIGSGNGNTSSDGRFVALGNERGMFVVDMDPQPPFPPWPASRIGPVYTFPPCSLSVSSPLNCAIGSLSISPSGRYIDLKYSGSTDTTADLHRVFEVDPVTLAISPHPMSVASLRCGSFQARPNGWIFPLKHSDLATDPFDGNEDVLVGGRACPGSSIGRLVMVRLRDGQVTSLTDPRNEAPFSHVSARNTGRPGWAYASYFRAPGKRFNGEIVAVKLDGSGEFEEWAHYHGLTPGCYRCEAHPVPSRDGKRVLFASNWATDCGDSCGAVADVKAYVAQFADTAEDTVPKPPIDHRFGLRGIYPNPTSVVPSVVYSLREGASAELVLVDLLGRVVLRRELGAQGPGEHEVVLDRSPVPAGIYWLRLREAGHVASARIVVLK